MIEEYMPQMFNEISSKHITHCHEHQKHQKSFSLETMWKFQHYQNTQMLRHYLENRRTSLEDNDSTSRLQSKTRNICIYTLIFLVIFFFGRDDFPLNNNIQYYSMHSNKMRRVLELKNMVFFLWVFNVFLNESLKERNGQRTDQFQLASL